MRFEDALLCLSLFITLDGTEDGEATDQAYLFVAAFYFYTYLI